jgi:hypothetical protein
MCHFWFNTAFVENSRLELTKVDIDRAHKDKTGKFPSDMKFILHFQPMDTARDAVQPMSCPESPVCLKLMIF